MFRIAGSTNHLAADWPSEIFGCTLDYDPIITFDHVSDQLLLDFTEDLGYFVLLDVVKAKITKSVESKDDFFTGYENMVYTPKFLRDTVIGNVLS